MDIISQKVQTISLNGLAFQNLLFEKIAILNADNEITILKNAYVWFDL